MLAWSAFFYFFRIFTRFIHAEPNEIPKILRLLLYYCLLS